MTYDASGNLTETEQVVVDADNQSHTITREWGYEPVWGWKTWEKDGRGYTTVYSFTKPDGTLDYKGRVWKQENPKDNDTIGWGPAFHGNKDR